MTPLNILPTGDHTWAALKVVQFLQVTIHVNKVCRYKSGVKESKHQILSHNNKKREKTKTK